MRRIVEDHWKLSETLMHKIRKNVQKTDQKSQKNHRKLGKNLMKMGEKWLNLCKKCVKVVENWSEIWKKKIVENHQTDTELRKNVENGWKFGENGWKVS